MDVLGPGDQIDTQNAAWRIWSNGEMSAGTPAFDFPQWSFPVPAWLVPLTSVGALVTESALLGNSVEEYAKDVEYGGAYLFAVLEPERATALLWFCGHRWNLEDIMGQGGSAVSVETWHRVEKWLEEQSQ